MASLLKQGLGGLVVLLAGSFLVAWSWYTALIEGYFYRGAAAFGPAFAILGMGLLLFPIDKQEMLKKLGVPKPRRISQYPPVWQALFLIALAAGLGNFLCLWLRSRP